MSFYSSLYASWACGGNLSKTAHRACVCIRIVKSARRCAASAEGRTLPGSCEKNFQSGSWPQTIVADAPAPLRADCGCRLVSRCTAAILQSWFRLTIASWMRAFIFTMAGHLALLVLQSVSCTLLTTVRSAAGCKYQTLATVSRPLRIAEFNFVDAFWSERKR